MSTDMTIFTDNGFATAMKISEALVKSGILPRGIDSPFKAFAIIQKGREIGVGPMRALTGISLIEGKPTVSPELKLELFRLRGGRVKWIKSDNVIAHLWLKAPNGDEHEEVVTIEDMKVAGVASKDNWRKYPKSMLRARCAGFGLRALGEGDGSYTPDELGAVTDEDGNAVEYVAPSVPAPNVPIPNKAGKGSWPSHVPKTSKAEDADKALTAEYTAIVRGEVAMNPEDHDPPQARLVDDATVEVFDTKTGEISKHPRPSREMVNKLQALRRELKIKEEAWKGGLKKYYSIDSSTLLTKAQCADMIDRLQLYADKGTRAMDDLVTSVKGMFPGAKVVEDKGDEPTSEELNGQR